MWNIETFLRKIGQFRIIQISKFFIEKLKISFKKYQTWDHSLPLSNNNDNFNVWSRQYLYQKSKLDERERGSVQPCRCIIYSKIFTRRKYSCMGRRGGPQHKRNSIFRCVSNTIHRNYFRTKSPREGAGEVSSVMSSTYKESRSSFGILEYVIIWNLRNYDYAFYSPLLLTDFYQDWKTVPR